MCGKRLTPCTNSFSPELELDLINTQMTHKPMLWAEVRPPGGGCSDNQRQGSDLLEAQGRCSVRPRALSNGKLPPSIH